ncbi:MAG: hypothetical protein Q4D16_00380 [Eubacteriales bacterium]|nr:hypothetical protein [Eubacteriales bacterium]
MKLFECIDGLLVGTKYLGWAIAVLGIVGSVVLFIVNIPLGFGTAAVFIASLFLSIGVTLLLVPKQLAKAKLQGNKKYIFGAVLVIIAVVVMGTACLANGGLPAVNLLFA